MSSEVPDPTRASTEAARALTERLARHTASELRYEVKGEIARGGMGAILEVFDGDLRRKLAMKVIRPREGAAHGAAGVDKSVLNRFLEEAQVTAQLSHPGVVPVHELGVDAQGRVFFTMSLVKGHDLKHVFDEVRGGDGAWTQTRALGALLKVCETMAYAHSKGVIHRDLKPANVMVGEFGEVYVMDWGLAKLAGTSDRRDLRPDLAATARVTTDRRDAAGLDPSSSLLTLDGAIVGTPSFMSPEQARGEALDHRSDIYALGAMLYALLTGQNPYAPQRAATSPLAIVQAIHKGPPLAVSALARDVPAELVAVCEKAMAREPSARYASMQALAEDVRAYLEGRVVKAYQTGAWAEFRKWVGRNKGTASALAGLLLAVIGGISVTAYVQTKAKQDVLRLADVKVLRDLEAQQETLWPPLPAKREALVSWVEQASELHARLTVHEQSLDALVASAPTNKEELWQIDVLKELIAELEALPKRIERVTQRRDFALDVEERTVTGEAARRRWKEALDDIASMPVYSGTRLTPQIGLLPLEPDPRSGLWEFWHVQSGEAPVRAPDTPRWIIGERTGIVLILVPGGEATLGSKRITLPGSEKKPESWTQAYALARQSDDYGKPYFDPGREADERFVEGVPLTAFFLSKYETTQSQWSRLDYANPSRHFDAASFGGPTHPVETFSWYSARQAAERLGLVLPTETQWEYACRAGTTTVFSSGEEFASLSGFANIADKTFNAYGQQGIYTEEVVDGWVVHAPVGSFEPNSFGCFDMHGNVWEWCLDAFNSVAAPRAGDGLKEESPHTVEGAIRGGSWITEARTVRSANRFNYDRNNTDSDVGVRFARTLDL